MCKYRVKWMVSICKFQSLFWGVVNRNIFVEIRGADGYMKACHYCPKQETYEIFVVLKADAVSCPRTVMIHSHYTCPTYTAMMGSWRFNIVTFLTEAKSLKTFVICADINNIFHNIFTWLTFYIFNFKYFIFDFPIWQHFCFFILIIILIKIWFIKLWSSCGFSDYICLIKRFEVSWIRKAYFPIWVLMETKKGKMNQIIYSYYCQIKIGIILTLKWLWIWQNYKGICDTYIPRHSLTD